MMLPKWHVGGAETQVMGLLRQMDTGRFSVSICLFGRGVESMEKEAAGMAEDVFDLDFRWRYFPLRFLRLVKYLQDGGFDVVHAHLACVDLVGRAAAWFAGVPVRVTTEHGKGLWKSPFQVTLERLMNRITDMRICVSRDIYRIRRDRERTPEDKLAYVPNGVDVEAFGEAAAEGGSRPEIKRRVMEEFGWPPDAPLVLSIGRIVEAKNYPLLADAFAALLDKVPGARCLIAGDGRCRREVEAAIEKVGVSGRMKLAGSREDIAALLAAADVFVLSSDREGLPVTLLEAMAARTPVVSTGVGGVPEAVTDGESALLTGPGDGAALACAMERILTEPGLAGRLADAAYSAVRAKFSMKSVTRRVEEIYLAALAEKRPGHGS